MYSRQHVSFVVPPGPTPKSVYFSTQSMKKKTKQNLIQSAITYMLNSMNFGNSNNNFIESHSISIISKMQKAILNWLNLDFKLGNKHLKKTKLKTMDYLRNLINI
jgi:hypothetical protein